MKFVQLTAVILLSCNLFLNSVRSTTRCDGWFGPECQLKCRCTNNSCDLQGLCRSGHHCMGGWFGPACQYADLAYTTTKLDMAEVTDGNDETCVDSTTVTNISIPLDVMLSWIRIHFKVSGVLDKLDIETNESDISTICNNKRKVPVDDRTLDIYCANTTPITQLVLSGEGTNAVCSVYISGGRNLALRQKASQSSTYGGYSASLAVDGNRNPDMVAGGSCSLTDDVTAKQSLGTWQINLSSPGLVNRYHLYNRNANTYRLLGITLESRDETGRIVFKYKNENPVAEAVYKLLHTDHVVKRVVITSGTGSNMMQICEFEMYGDSICPKGYYGLYCNMTCNCEKQEACLASTGSCPLGCAAGFHGADCLKPCEDGTFGSGCQETCSKFCGRKGSDNTICDPKKGDCIFQCVAGYLPPRCDSVCPPGKFGNVCKLTCSKLCDDNDLQNTTCHHVTGDCLFCKDGYQTPTCEKVCPPGKFGKACNLTCSKFCVDNGLQNTTCHHVTGACLRGCQGGYKPPTCEAVDKTAVEAGMFSMDIIIGMCVLLAMLLLLGYCLYPRMKAKPKGEMVVAEAHLSAPPAVL